MTFGPSLAGKTEIFDTLAVGCPRPLRAGHNSLLIRTNTDLVRRLFTPLAAEGSAMEKIHLQLRQDFQHVVQEQRAPAEGMVRFWQLDTRERVLQPGERTCTVKLSWDQPAPFVVLEADPQGEATGIEFIPEFVPTKMLSGKWGKNSRECSEHYRSTHQLEV